MSEKILVFNAYGGSNPRGTALAQWVEKINPDVAIIAELGRMNRYLKEVGEVYTHRAGHNPKDSAILVRRGKVDEVVRRQLTTWQDRSGTDAPRLWRDRHVVKVRIKNRVYYSIHGNAAICGPEHNWINNEGARVWRRALRNTLHEMLTEDMKAGRRIRLGGDWNFHKSDAEDSPNDYYRKHKMSYLANNLMWIGWTRRTDVRKDKRILGVAPGADAHRAMWVKLERRR